MQTLSQSTSLNHDGSERNTNQFLFSAKTVARFAIPSMKTRISQESDQSYEHSSDQLSVSPLKTIPVSDIDQVPDLIFERTNEFIHKVTNAADSTSLNLSGMESGTIVYSKVTVKHTSHQVDSTDPRRFADDTSDPLSILQRVGLPTSTVETSQTSRFIVTDVPSSPESQNLSKLEQIDDNTRPKSQSSRFTVADVPDDALPISKESRSGRFSVKDLYCDEDISKEAPLDNAKHTKSGRFIIKDLESDHQFSNDEISNSRNGRFEITDLRASAEDSNADGLMNVIKVSTPIDSSEPVLVLMPKKSRKRSLHKKKSRKIKGMAVNKTLTSKRMGRTASPKNVDKTRDSISESFIPDSMARNASIDGRFEEVVSKTVPSQFAPSIDLMSESSRKSSEESVARQSTEPVLIQASPIDLLSVIQSQMSELMLENERLKKSNTSLRMENIQLQSELNKLRKI